MTSPDYTSYTREELLALQKKLKTAKIVNAIIIGFMASVGIYALIKKGFTLPSIVPFFFILISLRNRKKAAAIESAITEEINKTQN